MNSHRGFRGKPTLKAAALLMALVCGLTLGCNRTLTDKEYIERAKQEQDKGDFRAAVIDLKNALRSDPNNLQARWLLGNVYIDIGDGGSAEKELKRSGELGIPASNLRIPLGRAYLLQGHYDVVLKEMQPAADLNATDSAWLHVLRGLAYLSTQKIKDAADEFDAALAAKADFPQALLGKAQIDLFKGDIQGAQGLAHKVLNENKNLADAWSMMGDIARSQKDAKAADEYYSKAISLRFNNAVDHISRAFVRISANDLAGAKSDIATLKGLIPGSPAIDYLSGNLEFQEKKYADAQVSFEKVLRNSPNDTRAKYYLGVVHAYQGHIQQSEQYLEQVANAYPNSLDVAKLLGQVRLYAGDYAGAEAVLTQALVRNPNDTDLLNLLGETALPQGKSKEGVEYFRRLIARQSDSATTHLKLGYGLLQEGKVDEGIQEVSKSLKGNPASQMADYLLVVAYLKANKPDEAIHAAQQLSKKNPGDPNAWTLMASAYLQKGDESQARQMLEQALQVSPGDPSAALNLARLELSRGGTEKARALFGQVLKYHKDDPAAQVALAQLDIREGNPKEAMGRLERVVKQDPDNAKAAVMLSGYYLRSGQPDRVLSLVGNMKGADKNPFVLGVKGEAQLALNQAENAKMTFRQLVAVVPESARAHYLLAKAYDALNHNDEVNKELSKALEINPDYLPAKLTMARLLLAKGSVEKAGKLAGELEQSYPKQPDVLVLKGQLALRQKHPDQAIAAYQQAMTLRPNGQVVTLLGIAQWQAGRQGETVATFKHWLDSHPADADVQYQLANTYLLLNRADEAKAAFSRMLELEPHHVLSLNNLAWLTRKDNLGKARKYAEQALEVAPDHPLVLDTLGEILIDQGDIDHAVRVLTNASTKSPGNFDIRYHLALALSKTADKDKAIKILKEILGNKQSFAARSDAEALAKALGG